jgi:transcriptional regulator with XRE-family HTH domain
MTAREFAEKLDIEENTLTSWERGERLIEPEDLASVRELTGVTADYIYYDDPSGLPPELVRNLQTE